MMSAAITLDGLAKTYPNGQVALRNFSLTVEAGEVFGFLGPNGAGKTSTIKIMLGLIRPSAGSVRLFGEDPVVPAARRRVGYLPEVANYYDFMNVVELLRFYGALSGVPKSAMPGRIAELLALTGLAEVASRPLKEYSKGMLQRAGIAQALLHDPDLLILDEPMTGLDPLGRMQIRDIIRRQQESGKTVFFSSHELSEAEMICNRVGILRQGEMAWSGPVSEVAGSGDKNLERIFLRLIQPQTETTEKAT
jgi:ABC-2 type transport system ATP-binding protein